MRLINADLPMEQMEKLLDHHLMMGNFSADGAVSDCIEFLKTAPTIDAELVRHGHWVHLGGDEWCCSNCGDVIFTEGSWEAPTNKYCQDCGAKMDEEGVR